LWATRVGPSLLSQTCISLRPLHDHFSGNGYDARAAGIALACIAKIMVFNRAPRLAFAHIPSPLRAFTAYAERPFAFLYRDAFTALHALRLASLDC